MQHIPSSYIKYIQAFISSRFGFLRFIWLFDFFGVPLPLVSTFGLVFDVFRVGLHSFFAFLPSFLNHWHLIFSNYNYESTIGNFYIL